MRTALRYFWLLLAVIAFSWWIGLSGQPRGPLVTVEQHGESRHGPAFADAVRAAVADLTPAQAHRINLVTTPSSCDNGMIVSLTVIRGMTFVSNAVLNVSPRDHVRMAQFIATQVAGQMR